MRYVVTEPVPGGDQWWGVADTQNKSMPNFSVATFWDGIPMAKEEAENLCKRLNER